MIITPPGGGSQPTGAPGTRRAAARKRQRVTRFVIGAGTTVAFALTLVVMHFVYREQPEPSRTVTASHVASPSAPDSPGVISDSGRVNYKYSIVAGGVRSAQEVAQAMENDPVVMSHYGNLRPSRLREEEIKELTLAHASYRIGDKVFWTKKKLALRPGEKVLTDGTTTIRERCGNLLTLTVEPLAPSLIDEPVPAEFEEVTPFVPVADSTALGDPPDYPVRPVATSSIEDDQMVPVPEPSTWVMVGLGLTAGVVRYLKNKRAA